MPSATLPASPEGAPSPRSSKKIGMATTATATATATATRSSGVKPKAAPSASSSSSTPSIPTSGPFTLRLHISGLSPSTTTEELASRFSTFASVPLPSISLRRGTHIDEAKETACYAFLDANFQEAKKWDALRRTWNGATWRGRKLGVHVARPDFAERLEAERKEEQAKEELRQRRRELKRKKRAKAKEAPSLRPVDEAKVEKGEWGWKKSPSGHLIRPLQLIPTRPLPTPTVPPSLKLPADATPKELKAARDKAKKRSRTKLAKALREAGKGKRCRLRVVDPLRYGVRHWSEQELLSQVGGGGREEMGEKGSWVCVEEEVDSDDDDDDEEEERDRDEEDLVGRTIKWVWLPLGTTHEELSAVARRFNDADADDDGEDVEGGSKRRKIHVEELHLPSVRSRQLKALGEAAAEEAGAAGVVVDWSKVRSMAREAPPSDAGGSDLSKLLGGDDEGESEGLFSRHASDEGEGEEERGDVELFSRHGSDEELDDDGDDEQGAPEEPVAPPLPFASYDPAEESDFSDGYEEGPALAARPQGALHGAAGRGGPETGQEREHMLSFLQGMFGQGLKSGVTGESKAKGKRQSQSADDEDDDEDDYDEVLRIAKGARKSGTEAEVGLNATGGSVGMTTATATEMRAEGEGEKAPPVKKGAEAITADPDSSSSNDASSSSSSSDSSESSEGSDQEGRGAGPSGEHVEGAKAAASLSPPSIVEAKTTSKTPAGVRFELPEGTAEASSSSDSDSDAESDAESDSDSSSSSSDDDDEDGAEAAPDVSMDDVAAQSQEGSRESGNIVKMSSLKDMFRPQEDEGRGFSLMSDLALELDEEDLDEELNFGPDEADLEPTSASAPSSAAHLAVASSSVGTGSRGAGEGDVMRMPYFFPLLEDEDERERDVLHLLGREGRENGGFVPFFRSENDEQLHARWASRRKELTEDYRRRHREAVKKRRRKVTGSRAQGGTVVGAARR